MAARGRAPALHALPSLPPSLAHRSVLPGSDKGAHLDALRSHIREFKATTGVDKVVVLW